MQDRGDELDLLLVALAELLGAPVGVFRDAEALEPVMGVPGRSAGQAVQRGEVDELLDDRRARIQPALLGQVAERPSGQVGGRRPSQRTSPAIGAQDVQANPHRGRLPCAVRAEETEDPTARHAEREVVEGDGRGRTAW